MRGLEDITCKLHEDDAGFDLEFRFESNDFFTDTVLKKNFVVPKEHVIEKIVGTEIQWKEGKNITEKKVKKKSKNKKGKSTKTVEQESFFNFFKSLTMPELSKELDDEEKEEELREIGDKMDEDLDIGNEIKD